MKQTKQTEIASAAATMGRKGGKAKGKRKARTTAQAKAAAAEKWRRYYASKEGKR